MEGLVGVGILHFHIPADVVGIAMTCFCRGGLSAPKACGLSPEDIFAKMKAIRRFGGRLACVGL